MDEYSDTTATLSPAEQPQLPPAANASLPAAESHAFTFTGSGQEYFRIWIVNLFLSVATLGIYSAWAKVRRLQYFDRNTQLAGASFDFRGDPKAILKGARRHPVELRHGASGLSLLGDSITRQYALPEVTLAEPFARAPLVLYFADGARCEVPDADAGRALADALGYRKSPVARWQQHWYAALLALVLLLAAGFAFVTWGLPAAAEKIAAAIPQSLDKRLGETAARGLEAQLMAPSRLSDERIAQVEQVLRSIVPALTSQPIRLLVRSSPHLGANALALPDGAIMITDAMVLQILGKEDSFDEDQTAQLAGVLAHEIGHIENRHSVRAMARSSLTAAASAAMFGDFSMVAAGAPAVVMNMRYSREMEYEADGYAIALLKEKGISPAPLADLFDALEKIHADDPESHMPRWMVETTAWASSHPASDERSERLRRAVQDRTRP